VRHHYDARVDAWISECKNGKATLQAAWPLFVEVRLGRVMSEDVICDK